jgi:hypothetical protein
VGAQHGKLSSQQPLDLVSPLNAELSFKAGAFGASIADTVAAAGVLVV